MTAASTKRTSRSDTAGTSGAGIQSLLVPLDLTLSSDRVLGRLSLLPLATDARVTLLHVVPGGLRSSEQRGAVRDATKALTDEARHLRGQLPKKVAIAAVVKVGNAAKEIAACAIEVNAELIVVGRGGGRALRDAFVGSTAERVIRQARLPVLLVRLPARSAYRRPALALELDQAAHEIVRVLLRVLPRPRPRVDVIHAVSVPYEGVIYPSLSDDDVAERKDALRATASRALAELLGTVLTEAAVSTEEVSFLTHVRYGTPRTVVEKVIKKSEADLLILGTRGYSGAAYLFLGTVAGDLLRAAKCDVLVVPPSPARD